MPTFTRRQVLRWGVAGTALLLPTGGLFGCGEDDAFLLPTPAPTPTSTPPPTFLTAAEQATVTAMTKRIVPTDDLPGALEAGAANYISRLLSIVPDEQSPGNVFAGGPFSGRNPFPDTSAGIPSNTFPPDDFAQFVPLTRLQLMSWRVQLFGSAAVAGAGFNDAVLGPVIGWRERYRTGVAEMETKSQQMFGTDFVALTDAQKDAVIAAINPSFLDLVTQHTIEGMLSPPEYGGNTDLTGWKLIRYDGDSQPLGYSIFDETTGTYRERPDKPTSTANPDEDFSGVDATTERFLALIVRVAGPHFP